MHLEAALKFGPAFIYNARPSDICHGGAATRAPLRILNGRGVDLQVLWGSFFGSCRSTSEIYRKVVSIMAIFGTGILINNHVVMISILWKLGRCKVSFIWLVAKIMVLFFGPHYNTAPNI